MEPNAISSVPVEGAPHVHRSQPFSVPVLLCGLATTAIALIGVYLLDRFAPDFNIMGWYANYILPIGALIVGVVASSGYGIAAWYSGLKISKKLLWLILALQACAYFAAQYIEFRGLNLVHRADNTPVSFFEYYDLTARSFAWKKETGGGHGEPLGVFGYFFRLLELLGFAASGLIVPAAMRSKPYCDGCQRYMHTKNLAWIPASIPLKKIKKKDTEGLAAHEAEQGQAMEAGKNRLESMLAIATAGKLDAFETELTDLKSVRKQAISLPLRFTIELVHCESCKNGRLHSALHAGLGQHVQRTEVGQTPIAEDFVQVLRSRK
jgi:hypothetical protein